MRNLGILLLLVGALALVYGGINYNRQHTVLEVGSMNITATEHRNVPVPAIVGVIVLIGGAALLVGNRRRA
jgi:uncharacterized membrane protein YidH (DUF202 family)